MRGARLSFSRSRRDAALCITTDTLWGLEADPEALAPAQRREVERFAREYQFFHWHLAFPEVFEGGGVGGFDCVLGNPPWERVKLQEKEWFADRSPEIADAPNAAARKRMNRALADDDPELYQAFLDALRQSEGRSHLMRDSGRYPPVCARRHQLLRGLRGGDAERSERAWVCRLRAPDRHRDRRYDEVLLSECGGDEVAGEPVRLRESEQVVPRRGQPDEVCLFTAGSGVQPAADQAEYVFFAHAVEELRDPERRFTLSPEDIALLNPNTRTCPTFRSRSDAELAKAIYRRVPVLVREGRGGQPEDNPWGIRFSTMFHMSNDSHLFRTREQLEGDGWELAGNVFRKDGMEYLPLYEAKMIHHFDHRWASYRREDGRDVAVDVAREDKQDPGFAVLPRYWVEAREVHLRVANLPKGLLTALRDRDVDTIALAICHLLFLESLRRCSGTSADRAIANVFPTWIDFVAYHPFAQTIDSTQMGLCGNSPAYIEPLGPSYLPAEPITKVDAGSCASTVWYAADPTALSEAFGVWVLYAELLQSFPSLRSEDEATTFAEGVPFPRPPRWQMGWRGITNSTNERTVVGGVFPFSAAGNSLPVWTTDSDYAVLLPAQLSSLVCDFAARFKVGGTNLNFFIAEQIPALSPQVLDGSVSWGTGESIREWLLPASLS